MLFVSQQHHSNIKNPYIIPAAIIGAAILTGFWMLKPSTQPKNPMTVQQPVGISINYAADRGNIEAVKQHTGRLPSIKQIEQTNTTASTERDM